MRIILPFIVLTSFLSYQNAWSQDKKIESRMKMDTSEAQATYKDIKQSLGMVPTFLEEYPTDAISGAWQDMKSLQLNPKTALTAKYKELIGLGVAAQIPCVYCTYFHKQAAQMYKASSREMKESIAVAASTRRWSTVLHGSQMDLAQFKAEVDQMMAFASKPSDRQAEEAPQKEIMTFEETNKDIEMHFGFIPAFLKSYPKASLAGAWKEFKTLILNTDTALTGKAKHLIGLAVASQIPCPYCTYFHTKSAMTQGASQEEVNEAIAMAGVTRTWSTVLNGLNPDEKKFKSETDQIMKFVTSKMPKEVTLK